MGDVGLERYDKVTTSNKSLAVPSDASLSGRALWLGFAAATTGTFMVNVDSSVVNVALPVMQRHFGLPIATLQWVVTAYLLIITGILPVSGQVADRMGRRGIFVAGIVLFTMGSLFCALAPGIGWLIAARVFQGIGGAAIMANVMAIIAIVFPPEQRGQALGLIGSVVAAGTLAGPPLGGVLTAALGWRSIFWINIPIGVWGIWGSFRYLPKFAPNLLIKQQPFDWIGAALFLSVTSLLQFGLMYIHTWLGWLFVGLTGVFLWGFVRAEKRDNSLVPLRLFSIRAFSANMIAGMAYWILMMFPAFLLPFYLRLELKLPIGWIGISLIPQALAMIVVSPWGGKWTDRVGVLLPARVGMGIFFVVDILFAVWPHVIPLWGIWTLLAAQGVSAGLFSSPNSAAILAAVKRSDTGLASSLMATQRNLGRAMGVGLASALLSIVWIFHGLGPTPSHTVSQYVLWFRWGFRGVFWSGAGFAILGMITTIRPDPSRRIQRT